MTYDLKNQLDRERFKARVNKLYQKGSLVDLTEKVTRTTEQNSYLHLLLGVVAMETGESLDYVKRYYYKQFLNPSLFVTEKIDPIVGHVTQLRSSADLTKEEMSQSIDRLKMWGIEQGWVMPDPEDREALDAVAREMGRMARFIHD